MERLHSSGTDLNPVYRERLHRTEVIEVCTEILQQCRNELFLEFRYLDVALATLKFRPDAQISGAGTDGVWYSFDPDAVIRGFRSSRAVLNRVYLHSIFHCLFGHPWNRKGRDIRLWNLAADIAAESVLDALPLRCARIPESALRRKVYRRLRAGTADQGGALTAGGIYRKLCEQFLPQETEAQGEVSSYARAADSSYKDAEELAGLEREFRMDDHRLWNTEAPDPSMQQPKINWDNIRDRMQTELESFSADAAQDRRSLTEQVAAENRSRYDYREFLRKFSVLKEEMGVDQDSFDYVYYHYGMELYGNMPLIEPLETKEVRKVEDFVIVIDTSMSCKGETVKQFLSETVGVLQESGSFFRRVCIHIIQCDDQIQEDAVIRDAEDMERYLRSFEVKGLGGTDFRPAFSYVAELLQRQAFTRLKGLIYFTDGYGTFPVVKPPYETAFVFLREHYRDADVPPWAIRLILEPEELEPVKTERSTI